MDADRLIANTCKLSGLPALLVDADLCEEAAGLVLNLTFPADQDSTVRSTLVGFNVVTNLTGMLECASFRG